MKTLVAVLIASLAFGVVLTLESPAAAAAKPISITIPASVARAISPAAARCPILAAGHPVTVTITPQNCRVYAAIVARNPALAARAVPITVTIRP